MGERLFPPGSKFLFLANVFRPGRLTGPQRRTRGALTALVVCPGRRNGSQVAVFPAGMRDRENGFFGAVLRAAYQEHPESANLDKNSADGLKQPIFVRGTEKGEVALMERLSRVVHRIHSPERQTEQICFFSFRIFGTRIHAPFRPYATTSAALASISCMEVTPTRNANGVWGFLWMRGVHISARCRRADVP